MPAPNKNSMAITVAVTLTKGFIHSPESIYGWAQLYSHLTANLPRSLLARKLFNPLDNVFRLVHDLANLRLHFGAGESLKIEAALFRFLYDFRIVKRFKIGFTQNLDAVGRRPGCRHHRPS